MNMLEKPETQLVTRRTALKITSMGLLSLLIPVQSIRKAEAGWGACSVSGCPCQAFQQTYGSDLCSNCGHRYTDHW
jgi:hypothetical protein